MVTKTDGDPTSSNGQLLHSSAQHASDDEFDQPGDALDPLVVPDAKGTVNSSTGAKGNVMIAPRPSFRVMEIFILQ